MSLDFIAWKISRIPLWLWRFEIADDECLEVSKSRNVHEDVVVSNRDYLLARLLSRLLARLSPEKYPKGDVGSLFNYRGIHKVRTLGEGGGGGAVIPKATTLKMTISLYKKPTGGGVQKCQCWAYVLYGAPPPYSKTPITRTPITRMKIFGPSKIHIESLLNLPHVTRTPITRKALWVTMGN